MPLLQVLNHCFGCDPTAPIQHATLTMYLYEEVPAMLFVMLHGDRGTQKPVCNFIPRQVL